MDEQQERDQIGLVNGPEAPKGGTEEKGGQFLNMTRGQAVKGTIVGTQPIPNQRDEMIDRYLLVDDNGETWILPDHVDLVRKLKAISGKLGFGAYVWILYRGKDKIEGVAQPMAIYKVVNYGTLPVSKELTKAHQAFRSGKKDEEVPF